ncbi:MAG: MbnP family protein [Prosthecobacter sp.]
MRRASLGLALATILGGVSPSLMAQNLRIEFRAVVGEKPLRINEPLPLPAKPRITRLDLLLSGLALRRMDGTWLESANWYAYLSATKKGASLTAEGTDTPPGEYTGIRFRIGVNEIVNKADPNSFPPDHALNPQVNGLHWGWMGGYIFTALEGRFQNAGREDGFSFHVANAPQLMTVELPVDFHGGSPLTMRLDFDVQQVLSGIDFLQDGTSTHSRAGDPLAARLKNNIEQAFRVRSVHYDVYQTPVSEGEPLAPPFGTHPYTPAMTRRFPQVTLPQDNPLTKEGVALGRLLFHDTRLSVNGSQSCASCHEQSRAFSDSRRFSTGAEQQQGRRNAMPLFNLAWHDSFFWDGRAPSLRQQVLMPITDPAEMNETLPNVIAKLAKDETVVGEFKTAFGTPGITAERIAKALEQFLLTIISQESKFDHAVRKLTTLTESEKRGLQLFVTEFDPKRGLRGADCFHCHGGTLFTSQDFANNGLELDADDTGLMGVTGKEDDRGKFKVPSLRNIALTAPYMHDGRFATLEEVVEHYSGGVRRTSTLDPNLAKHPATGIQLTPQEKADLVAFLKTLTDQEFTGVATKTTAAR